MSSASPQPTTQTPVLRALARRAHAEFAPTELALRWLLAALDRLDVPVVCLRGDRDLPRLAPGSDLDLACLPRHRARFDEMLARATRRYGVEVVERHRAGFLTQYQLHAVDGEGGHHHACIDLHTAEACFGVPFLPARDLMQGRSRRRGHARPDVVVSAVVDFLGPYLSGGALKDEYVARLATTLEQRPAQTRALLGRLFGTKVADELGDALRRDSRRTLFRLAVRARRRLLGRRFLAAPLRSTLSAARFFAAARIRPLFQPRGRTVAVIGPDGSGKSTLVEALRKELSGAFRGAEGGVVKLRPGVLPQLDRVAHAGRSTYDAKDCERPHRAASSGTLGTWMRASWYWLDYVLGWPAKIRPRMRRNSLIVFDRYIDDWLVDPARFRMKSGSAFVRFLVELAPRPDVTLVCSASLRNVRNRKREVDARESLRQLEAYEELAASRHDFHVIDTDESIEEAVAIAQDALFGRPRPTSWPRPLPMDEPAGTSPSSDSGDAREAA